MTLDSFIASFDHGEQLKYDLMTEALNQAGIANSIAKLIAVQEIRITRLETELEKVRNEVWG